MRFLIHGTCKDGVEDAVIVEGDTIKDIRKKADREAEARGWSDCWSEEV